MGYVPKRDLTGQTYGRWFVIKYIGMNKSGQSQWLCRCTCGKEQITGGSRLYHGRSKGCRSCQAGHHLRTHGLTKTPLFKTWSSMKIRCKFPTKRGYYLEDKIKVCEEWLNNSSAFFKWALENGYKEGLTIDRIDNKGDYTPENCRFVDWKTQNRNRRNTRWLTIGGVTKLNLIWAKEAGINTWTLSWRIKHGWPEHRLLEPRSDSRSANPWYGR